MRIHVDGCDKTGKSTLIKFLSEQLGYEVVKFSQPETDNPFKEYEDFLIKTAGNKKHYICDRSWLSENIYGPIYRDKGLTEKEFERLDTLCKANNDLFIITHQDPNIVAENFIIEKEEFAQQKDIEALLNWFLIEGSRLTTDRLLYNYRLQNQETIYKAIKGIIYKNTIDQLSLE